MLHCAREQKPLAVDSLVRIHALFYTLLGVLD